MGKQQSVIRIYKNIYFRILQNIKKKYGKRKKQPELITFTKTAFKLKEYPAFLALSLTLLLLPGSNYYLDLKLQPRPPFIRDFPIEVDKPSDYPVRNNNIPDPVVSARAAVVIDVNSGVTLFAKNPHQKLLPASTTKIMTALVALEHYPHDRVLTVKKADRSIGQTMDLYQGEKMTVENLLYGLLMHSGNDAAFALAENYEGGYYAFVEEMNRLSEKLHLTETQFRNVSGIDQQGHETTVSDLARLARIAMKNDVFATIVSTKKKVVSDVNQTTIHRLTNINQLLGNVEGIRGVKTGWTEQAGECLVTDTVRDGREIITVVLGSNNRFGESKKLIEWAFTAHQWVDLNI